MSTRVRVSYLVTDDDDVRFPSLLCVSQMLVLETFEHAIDRGAHIYCELVGGGSSNDAHHVTHPDPAGRGAALAMRRALESASMSPHEIGYVNAHATSTPAGDEAELRAIAEVFGDKGERDEKSHCARTGPLSISSTKGATGHLLAAAGAAEAAFTALAVHHARIPPTINLENPIALPVPTATLPLTASHEPRLRLVPHVDGGEAWQSASRSSEDGRRRAALSNSFGFGGTNASLIFREFHF